jgi:hypothetical protein
MKHLYPKTFIWFYLLVCPFIAVAQNIIGPLDVYVSKQNPPANNVLFAGSLPAWADEGRVVNIGIYNIQGPITVDPVAYTLNGPPCPTYNATGARIPAAVQPNATATFTGNVKMQPGDIPEPGGAVDAEFSGKDNGFWTKCSTGEKTFFTLTETAKFKIHSINLVLDQHQAFVCNGMTTQIGVQTRYPAAGTGSISWVSRKGKVSIIGDDNGARLNYVASGNDVLVATLNVNGAIFRDSVILEVGEIKFAEATYHYLAPVDDDIDVTTLLAANSIKNNLQWFFNYNGGGEQPLANTKFSKAGFRAGDRCVIIAKRNGMAACQASTELRFYYIDLSIAKWQVCDGEEMPFSVVIRPAVTNALRNQLLGTVAGLAPKYSLRAASFGNPRGNTNLTFGAFNGNWASKIDNMIWYANQAAQCNNTSDYKLWVDGKINGKDIASYSYWVTADVNGGTCCNGSAYPIQEWSGFPIIRTRYDNAAGKWCGWIDAVGTFKRDVKCATTNICKPNSQYRAPIQAEENYHVGQMELTNGSVVCATMWDINNIFRGIMPRCWYASTQVNARALTWHVFFTRRNLESARSWGMFAYPSASRCAMEREAKVQTGITHRFKFSCAYPACPQP